MNPQFAKHGYSLTKGFFENEEALDAGSKVSAILVSCIALERISVPSCSALRYESRAI